ncbi:hypothetical protein GOP47_0003215 [Adiantum capillus-veneris]|uniref:Uncharacterized protein n=1 Tax=Adiantum capillus-veneris TaxID=13818 RepID=A0A9D4VDJ3_ADICA|nr:hypothetical protein GOP47_0003215 [Adiantum capillus-veneris]
MGLVGSCKPSLPLFRMARAQASRGSDATACHGLVSMQLSSPPPLLKELATSEPLSLLWIAKLHSS